MIVAADSCPNSDIHVIRTSDWNIYCLESQGLGYARPSEQGTGSKFREYSILLKGDMPRFRAFYRVGRDLNLDLSRLGVAPKALDQLLDMTSVTSRMVSPSDSWL